MFENHEKNMISESLGALIYLIKENPVRTVLYIGIIPFAVPYAIRGSLNAGFVLQAYLLTTMVFIYVPFRTEKQEITQRWFWKAMIVTGVLVHPFFLLGMWYVDSYAASPSFVIGGATLFLLLLGAGAVEIVVLGSIVSRFRPLNQG